MAQKKLNLEALQTIDNGRIAAAFNMELERIVRDIDDRGTDGTNRTLKMEITFTPVVRNSMVEDVDTEIQIQGKVPPKRSRVYRMAPHGSQAGMALKFNDFAPENAHQGTLDETGGEGKAKGRN